MNNYGKTLNLKTISKWYDDWFLKTVDSAFHRTGTKDFSSGIDWLTNCGYVQTITFNQSFTAMQKTARELGSTDTTMEFDTFHGGYIEITKALVNHRYYQQARFASLWPMAFVGIDFEGSRYSGPTKFSDRNLHVHAIWCVHPDVQDRFEAFVGRPDLLARFKSYGPCDAVEFKRYKKPTSGSHTYGIKAHTKTAWNPSSVEDIRIYPNHDWAVRKIGYRKERTQQPLGYLRMLQIGARMNDEEEKRARRLGD